MCHDVGADAVLAVEGEARAICQGGQAEGAKGRGAFGADQGAGAEVNDVIHQIVAQKRRRNRAAAF